jgi:integral membrane protein (TIGR01906 family)
MKILKITGAGMIALLVPFVLLMTSVRILFNPWFINTMYSLPRFPADEYGFSKEERTHWALISLDYLFKTDKNASLAEYQLEDGSPLYNERELSHMLDVRNLLQQCISAWIILSGILLVLGILATFARWLPVWFKGLSIGGWGTIVLMMLVLTGVITSFDWLFTEFHHLFFSGDSWLFFESDTLIRLFPEELWITGFALVAVLTLILSIAFGLGFGKLAKQKAGTSL